MNITITVHPDMLSIEGEGRRSLKKIVILEGTLPLTCDCRSYAIYNLDVCQADSLWLATLSGGWLGSSADEGRAKLRYALGRRKEPMIQR